MMENKPVRWELYVLAVCCLFALLTCFFPPKSETVSSQDDAVFVPIIMYHSLLADSSRAGQYVVSPDTFEADLRYLLDQGYETIVMQDLIDYVYHGEPLPDHPVIISFDDGHLNTLTYGLPILEMHKSKAIVSVVGGYVDDAERDNDPNPHYAYAAWDDLAKMQTSGCFEIQNHSYGLHQNTNIIGVRRKEGEVLASYQQRLISDVVKMQSLLRDHLNIVPSTFTYPFGLLDNDAELILRDMGFIATLTCVEQPNYITHNPSSLYLLGRYNRPSGISTSAFMEKVLSY